MHILHLLNDHPELSAIQTADEIISLNPEIFGIEFETRETMLQLYQHAKRILETKEYKNIKKLKINDPNKKKRLFRYMRKPFLLPNICSRKSSTQESLPLSSKRKYDLEQKVSQHFKKIKQMKEKLIKAEETVENTEVDLLEKSISETDLNIDFDNKLKEEEKLNEDIKTKSEEITKLKRNARTLSRKCKKQCGKLRKNTKAIYNLKQIVSRKEKMIKISKGLQCKQQNELRLHKKGN